MSGDDCNKMELRGNSSTTYDFDAKTVRPDLESQYSNSRLSTDVIRDHIVPLESAGGFPCVCKHSETPNVIVVLSGKRHSHARDLSMNRPRYNNHIIGQLFDVLIRSVTSGRQASLSEGEDARSKDDVSLQGKQRAWQLFST
jgi:hypothetical protein